MYNPEKYPSYMFLENYIKYNFFKENFNNNIVYRHIKMHFKVCNLARINSTTSLRKKKCYNTDFVSNYIGCDSIIMYDMFFRMLFVI